VIILVPWFLNSQQLLQVEGLWKIAWNEFAAAIMNWKLHVGLCELVVYPRHCSQLQWMPSACDLV
jgi:hypothetical protein